MVDEFAADGRRCRTRGRRSLVGGHRVGPPADWPDLVMPDSSTPEEVAFIAPLKAAGDDRSRCRETHRHGLLAVAHTLTVDATGSALAAGGDGLVGLFMDKPHTPQIIDEVTASGAFVVPCVVLKCLDDVHPRNRLGWERSPAPGMAKVGPVDAWCRRQQSPRLTGASLAEVRANKGQSRWASAGARAGSAASRTGHGLQHGPPIDGWGWHCQRRDPSPTSPSGSCADRGLPSAPG